MGMLAGGLVGLADEARADPLITIESGAERHAGEFIVPVNKSQVLSLDQTYTDLAIGNPSIADVLPLTERSIYVLGQSIGTTNLLIYGKERRLLAVVDLVVTYDLESLKRRLHEILPGETIEVRPVGDSLALQGVMSNSDALASAVAIAEKFAPEHVTNLLAVKGRQEVMLAVKIVELDRSVSKELGINTRALVGLDDSKTFAFETGLGLGTVLSGASFATGVLAGTDLAAAFDVLEEKNLGRILAEPNLVAMSGDTASFLAGGEFPIPVVQSGTTSNAITVEFKEFGVALSFTPTVIDENRINLLVSPEVSAIDFSTAVTTGGVSVPGLSTRRATTMVELADGESFAIAGLLQNDITNAVSQVPWLGDIPILGTLFRSSQFQRNETELVIIVTPYLVRPTMPELVANPDDGFVPASDIDFFLYGRIEAPSSAVPPAMGASGATIETESAGGMDGSQGYIVQ